MQRTTIEQKHKEKLSLFQKERKTIPKKEKRLVEINNELSNNTEQDTKRKLKKEQSDIYDTIEKFQKTEIDYFLNIAPLLNEYNEDSLNMSSLVENDSRMGNFVNVTYSQNKKGTLYNEYMNKVERAAYDVKAIDTYVCNRCNSKKIVLSNDSSMLCPTCGVSELFFDTGTAVLSYEQEIATDTNTCFSYKRISHFNEWLAQFQAKENTEIPQDLIENVINEFKKARIYKTKDITQTKVKLFLKKLKYNKYYDHVPHITNMLNGIKPSTMGFDLEERLRNMFREIQEPFEKNKPKSRSNFLSYSYCLYKFCELLGKDEFLACFPLLKSREKLHEQDKMWRSICSDLGWQYIPTV